MKTAMQTASRPSGEISKPSRQFTAPEVNIVETPEAYVLTAEMPGVGKTGLEVTLEGSELTLIGHRNTETPSAELHFRESCPADYRRVFELDPSIDARKITAQMEQGVLTLRLSKADRVKPRKIEVTE